LARLCLLHIFLYLYLPSPAQNIQFERIPNELGLSQNLISAIVQDDQGFLWVGTKDGLNRFDGYHFKVFKNAPSDSNTISDNYIKSLYIDSCKRLWIGTSNGLNLYNPEQESFYLVLPQHNSALKSASSAAKKNEINDIIQDGNGTFWVSTNGSGLYKMKVSPDLVRPTVLEFQNFGKKEGLLNDAVKYIIEDGAGGLWINMPKDIQRLLYHPESETYELIDVPFSTFDTHWQEKVKGLRHFIDVSWREERRMLGMVKGKNGNVWIASPPGMVMWDAQQGDFSYYPLEEILADYPIFVNSLAEGLGIIDQNGQLWFGSYNSLVAFKPYEAYNEDSTYTLELALHTKMDELPEGFYPAVTSMYEDRSGNIWIGSNGLGLYKVLEKNRQFIHYSLEQIAPSVPSIRAIAETEDGSIWIATTSFRFFRFDRSTGRCDFIKINPVNRPNYEGYVRSMHPDRNGNLWLSGPEGVTCLLLNSGTINGKEVYRLNDGEGVDNKVYDITQGADGKIWIITGSHFGWLDQETKTFQGQPYLPTEIDARNARNFPCIYPHGEDAFWLGTLDGLKYFDLATQQFTTYRNDPQDAYSLSNNTVRCIQADPESPNDILWIGTAGGGLNRFEIKTGKSKRFGIKEGLPDDVIYGLLDDSEGNLWLSTNQGLCRFNPQTYEVKKFTTADGLQDNEFNTGAHFKSKSGELFFGGLNGFNAFYPENIKDSPFAPPVVITDFRISNQSVDFRQPDSPLKASISQTKTITLSHREKVLTFSFTALDFTNPQKNEYAYRLLNFEEDWQYIGTQRTATFTNLDPGTYTFQVKATNHDGIWNETPTTLEITIQPPWWQTWWAYTGYLLVLLSVIIFIYRFQLTRQLAQAEAENLRTVDQFKTRFYTNITHEFRTPLTVILGMLEQIQGHQKERSLIRRNSEKLLRLINQMLDLSKLESNKLSLHLVKADIIPYLRYLTESFHSLAEVKGIELAFYTEVQSYVMDFDEEKVQQVIYNLFSNALKFTEKGGMVSIRIKEIFEAGKPQLELKIQDTGIGIPADALPHIFDRFYQTARGRSMHQSEGTGIGLALTKELVMLMEGAITVESELEEGTTFTVTLPAVSHTHVSTKVSVSFDPNVPAFQAISDPQPAKQKLLPRKANTDKPLVLIVEDNPDVTTYIEQLLKEQYQTRTASDGQEGMDVATEWVPDIIITDVMMPRKNGYELCESLKTDERTSHIPIVMLTAKATEADRLTGLKTGADAYLMKPFNKEELFVRLEKLLELRRKLQKHYAPAYHPLKKLTPEMPSLDELFLEKIRQIIDEKIDDADLDIEFLCQKVHLSSTQLFRKMKALTGEPPMRFVRKVRLHKAMELLQTAELNVSEIAYELGFTDPHYFSRAFKKEFGTSPSNARNI
jgi:signal transduction histidine kinase/ligand-binding sensor domain-containing protein/DNA-binding response OmpR family regulator